MIRKTRTMVRGACALAAVTVLALCVAQVQAQVLPLTNTKAGISLSLSGTNGVDWAVERTYHDDSIADQIIYLKSAVNISLAHNARNSIMIDTGSIPHVIGVNGQDGQPDTGDEGDIYYKIDRDLQAHLYSTKSGPLPSYCVKYAAPFSFQTLTYDGSLAVLGRTGDNGGAWGSKPLNTTARFAYGQTDGFGNQWHTLTYWDDDEPLLAAAGVGSQRLGASDGHCVFVCVNPQTPVIQLAAPAGQEFYTTPIKTYHVPKIWEQTTYLTGGVTIHLVNLTNGEAVQYRVGQGAWQTYGGTPLVAGDQASELVGGYVETRAAGVSRLQITFSRPLDPATATSGAISIVGQTGGDKSSLVGSVTLTGNGSVMQVGLSGSLPDADRYTVTVAATVTATDGQALSGQRSVALAVLAGDIDGSGQVDEADLTAVRAAAGKAVVAGTSRYDVDLSGDITSADLRAARIRLGSQLP